jgi:cysteine synthase A
MEASMPSKADDIAGLVGNTPLVRLKGPSERSGAEIWGKCEFMNPGGSVKDRAALWIIRDAEASGALKPGGTIVEGTAGNTGIGLAVIGGALGYRTVIVMPETQSQEKKDALRALGAELVLVPATSYANPGHYVHTSRRLAEETPGAVWANQFDNVANRLAHIKSTAPEIIAALEGRVDGFICAAGTGGTVAGVGLGLKAELPDVTIGLADPDGAALYSWFTSGELKSEGNSVSEGIGQSRITANLEGAPIDVAFRVSDAEAFPVLHELMARDGLHLGLSSAINVAGAEKLAAHLAARDGRGGHRIVTILCDNGSRYLSTIWNPEWLNARGLPLPPWRRG